MLYAGLTAWSGLYITGGLGGPCGAVTAGGGGAHKRVLVLGGSGGVGSLAIQMLKSQKVQVLATCSENAIEMVRNLGADLVVDYSNGEAMEELCKYAPYDIVLDCSGQGGEKAADLKFDFRQYITFSSPVLANIDKQGLGLGALKNVVDLVQTNVRSVSQRGASSSGASSVPLRTAFNSFRNWWSSERSVHESLTRTCGLTHSLSALSADAADR